MERENDGAPARDQPLLYPFSPLHHPELHGASKVALIRL